MRKVLYLLLICCIYSCSQKNNEKVSYISADVTSEIKGKLYLSEDIGLNTFYDISASDSLLYCLDFHNDTILKIFAENGRTQQPELTGYSIKGEGPDDLLFPFFAYHIPQAGIPTKLIELNAWGMKELGKAQSHSLHRVSFDTAYSLPPIPVIKNYNETDSSIIGFDIDMQHGLFFIYNKKKGYAQTIQYPHTLSEKYPKTSISSLLENQLLVNQKENRIAVGMLNMNILYLFDLEGDLQKEIVIGEHAEYPEVDTQYLDFPQSNKYFISFTGTENFLYGLYNGFSESSGHSRILKFTWDGELIATMQTNMKLEKIIVRPDNSCIFGIKTTEEGGTDLFKFNLPGDDK